MLLEEARAAGADMREAVSVKQILSLALGDVRVLTSAEKSAGNIWLMPAGRGRWSGGIWDCEKPRRKNIFARRRTSIILKMSGGRREWKRGIR